MGTIKETKKKKDPTKGSWGWFQKHTKSGFMDVEKNNEIFNHISGTDAGNASTGDAGGATASGGMGESLMQDLHNDKESIKDTYGEEVYNALNDYCSNPNNDLGDVLYTETGWERFVNWCAQQGISVARAYDVMSENFDNWQAQDYVKALKGLGYNYNWGKYDKDQLYYIYVKALSKLGNVDKAETVGLDKKKTIPSIYNYDVTDDGFIWNGRTFPTYDEMVEYQKGL